MSADLIQNETIKQKHPTGLGFKGTTKGIVCAGHHIGSHLEPHSLFNFLTLFERRKVRLKKLILHFKQQEIYGYGTQNLFRLLRADSIPRTRSLQSQPRLFAEVVFNVYLIGNTVVLLFVTKELFFLCFFSFSLSLSHLFETRVSLCSSD